MHRNTKFEMADIPTVFILLLTFVCSYVLEPRAYLVYIILGFFVSLAITLISRKSGNADGSFKLKHFCLNFILCVLIVSVFRFRGEIRGRLFK